MTRKQQYPSAEALLDSNATAAAAYSSCLPQDMHLISHIPNRDHDDPWMGQNRFKLIEFLRFHGEDSTGCRASSEALSKADKDVALASV